MSLIFGRSSREDFLMLEPVAVEPDMRQKSWVSKGILLLTLGLIIFAGFYNFLASLAGVYILSALITQPMSNAAAVVRMAPITVDIAFGLGANHQPLVQAAVIGVSTSFLTPVGHEAKVLVVWSQGGIGFLIKPARWRCWWCRWFLFRFSGRCSRDRRDPKGLDDQKGRPDLWGLPSTQP